MAVKKMSKLKRADIHLRTIVVTTLKRVNSSDIVILKICRERLRTGESNTSGINAFTLFSRPEEEIEGWDVFKYFPLRRKTGSRADTRLIDNLVKLVKALTYVVLFLFVLCGGVLAKLTIIFAASQITDDGAGAYCDYNDFAKRPSGTALSATLSEESRILWYWCIALSFAFPEVIGILSAAFHFLFRKTTWPEPLDIVLLLVTDGLHAVGLALLFLLVIPELNSVQALILSSCTCIVPAILGLFSHNNQRYPRRKSYLAIVGGTAAFAGQLCGILIWLIPDSDDGMTPTSKWILPLALVLTSCRWWSNYVSSYSTFGFIHYLSLIKERQQATKGITQGCTAVWRIIVFLGTLILIAFCKGIEPASLFDKSILVEKHKITLVDLTRSSLGAEVTKDAGRFIIVESYYLPVVVFILHAASSFITYLSGRFAYRALMQGYGYALPTIFTVPTAIVTLVGICTLRNSDTCVFHGFLPDYAFFDVPTDIDSLGNFLDHWYAWIWLLTLSSQAWLTMHVWSPHSERLASTERIFVVPTYDSLIIDQSIALNRQIDDSPIDDPMPERLQSEEDTPFEVTYSNRSSDTGLSPNKTSDRVTRIIACATMWHETEDEMGEFIGSIMRLDTDQGSKRFTQGYYNLHMKEYYELETHVFFDDAFRCMHGCDGRCKHDENETQVNDYVITLIDTMRNAIERLHLRIVAPMKYPAPYGGRLEWTLPGQTRLVVHLKDKNKIRHRKRWSQVMYMYYLLGYRLMDRPISHDRKATIAENTYLLTLDGDIDFRPSAVKVLVDLMKRNKELGAACGRIHPMGTGPMVWFQTFEYAIGHWLQKSTEHTIGSVLCSPGCFSLFRARALMEHNVMKKYAIQSTEPRHYVQYDQGEDRWLCTLILQVGYRVEYSAASDSYTHAPETFNEFYNQRRRWIPSTIANIFDLLATAEETRKGNPHISWLYIAYQWVLMGSTVLGPGTIFLMLVGAFVAAFRIDNWSSFGYNLIPIAAFVVVCFACTARIQLIVAGIISAFYGLVMIVVLVGIMIQITEDGWVAPSTILFFVVAGQLVVAGLLHPQEWACLLCGLIYYVTVPSMYMLLIIFSLFNVNNVTWGTRDSKTPAVDDEQSKDAGKKRNETSAVNNDIHTTAKKGRGSIEFSLGELFRCMLCTQNSVSDEERKLENISEALDRVVSRLDAMEKNTAGTETQKNHRSDKFIEVMNNYVDIDPTRKSSTQADIGEYTDEYDDGDDDDDDDVPKPESESDTYVNGSNRDLGNFLVSPHWLQDERLRKFGVEFLSREEENFWERLIEKYLYPIDEDKKQLAKTAEGLRNLRDEYLFKFFMLNALFVLIVFLMQLNKDILHIRWPLGVKYNISFSKANIEVHVGKEYLKLEPLGCLFIVTFVVILGVQFIAMLFHRFETFTHVLAKTSVDWFTCSKPVDPTGDEELEKHAENVANGLQFVVENHAEIAFARRTSAVPPGKRKTVQELAESQDKRVQLPASLDTLFRRNLNNPESDISRLLSTRMSRRVVEAFERRRSTLVAKRRRSQLDRPEADNIYNSPDSINVKSRNHTSPSENSYIYDNRAFVLDNCNDDPAGNHVTIPHRPSQVTFSNNVNA